MDQFYKVPQLKSSKNKEELETLQMGDRLIYAWMKTNANYIDSDDKDQYSFPGYKSIANNINKFCEPMGNKSHMCTENFVSKSIKRLEQVKWIQIIRRKGQSNKYKFLKWENFDRCSKEFLEKKNLTWKEKDFFLQLQQYIFTSENEAYMTWDYGKIAEALCLSYPTVKKYMVALKRKQVFVSTVTTMRNPETHLPITRLDFDLESIGAQILKQVVKNTQDIQETKEDVEDLKEQLRMLTEKVEQLAKEGTGD